MSKPIKNIFARTILDSRGEPTLEVGVETAPGVGVFGVPSGASKGSAEALELRDGGKAFLGKGVMNAVRNVNDTIAQKIKGMDVFAQNKIDETLIKLDGTRNKSRLGANAILGVSGAVCKAAALTKKMPLYKYVASLAKNKLVKLPRPMVNVINGGAHADTNLDIQEFMLMPNTKTIWRSLEMAAEIFQALKRVLKGHRLDTDLGNEGGYSPNWESNKQPLVLIMEAVRLAGYKKGTDVQIAIDAAATRFFKPKENQYVLSADRASLTAERLVSLYSEWINEYSVFSVEDGLSEKDWDGWSAMAERLDSRALLVGDDLFATQIPLLKKGLETGAANAIIIKPNQVGTITETLATVQLAKENGLKIVASHRSGETNDDFIADFAVGIGADFLKAGSVARGERVAKWNRLLAIEDELNG